MIDRSLVTVLKSRLSAEQLKQIGFTAESIGIAGNTLRTLLADDWDQLSRSTIEQVCNYFNLGPADLFRLVPTRFWRPLLAAGECSVVRGDTRVLGRLEDQGISAMANRLQGRFPEVKFVPAFPSSPRDVIQFVRSHNCILLGSPKTNAATEVVLSRMLGAQPFKANRTNRKFVRFRFAFPPDGSVIASQSTLGEAHKRPSVAKGSTGFGIWDGKVGQMLVHADWWPRDSYLPRTVQRGRDAAVVAVINRPFNTTRDVKTIVLAGLGSVGTEAALRGLLRDYRDLEPADGSRFTLGVLEATFKKPKEGVDERRLTGFRWRFLRGGRRSIEATHNDSKSPKG